MSILSAKFFAHPPSRTRSGLQPDSIRSTPPTTQPQHAPTPPTGPPPSPRHPRGTRTADHAQPQPRPHHDRPTRAHAYNPQPNQHKPPPRPRHTHSRTTRPPLCPSPVSFRFPPQPGKFCLPDPPRSPRRGETWPIRPFPPTQTVQVEAENARFVSICTPFPGVYTKFVSISPFLHSPHAPSSRRYLWSRGHTAIPSTPTARITTAWPSDHHPPHAPHHHRSKGGGSNAQNHPPGGFWKRRGPPRGGINPPPLSFPSPFPPCLPPPSATFRAVAAVRSVGGTSRGISCLWRRRFVCRMV